MRCRTVLTSILLALPFLLFAPEAAAQSPLTLPAAVEIALEKNPTRKVALAEEEAAAAGVRLARSDLWPQVELVESFTRSNDPVWVFGTKLRQQQFSSDDFSLARLNTPGATNNFATRFTANWNVFDFKQSWLKVDRARHLHRAAGRQLERTEQELVFRVVDAYFGLLLARKQREVDRDALRTAEANLERSRARFEADLVVESDLLSAEVNLAARQQALIQADNRVEVAHLRLNHELGVAMDSLLEPVEVLAEPSLALATVEELEARALEGRPDLAQVTLQETAQEKSVAIAKAAYGPRVDLVADWEADNQAFLGNGGTHWLGGVRIEFDVFQGGARSARLARERALRDRLAAERARVVSHIQMEVRQAYLDLGAAGQQVEVARSSVDQAKESLRIIQNRYDAGLTTITDLLRAEEAAQRSQTQYWQAVYQWQIGYANLELATGTLNAGSPVVRQ